MSIDTFPAGARVDVAARNLLPVHADDRLVYVRSVAGVAGATTTRAVTSGPDAAGAFAVTETSGLTTRVVGFRSTSDGIVLLDPLHAMGTLPGAYSAMPEVLIYPTPFHAAGGTTLYVRQGNLLADIDGDGAQDYFRAELSLRFVGFETLMLFGRSVEVAHVRTDLAFTTQSGATGVRRTTTNAEDVYFAGGVGPIRIDRSATGPAGTVVEPAYRLDLQGAVVGGVLFSPSRTVALNHEALVYDAARRVYYASITSTDASFGNRIATIDALSGAITYSAPVGSSPKALALTASGSDLYVGLDGSGEVIRLQLPSMAEVSRVRLPPDPFFGQLFAEEIVASPLSPDVVAVSMYRKGISPRHGGVALVRSNVVQPLRTQDHTGSNSIAFDPSGTWLYGYNNETTEFGLRRIEVLANGLIERTVLNADARFNSRLRLTEGLALISNRAFRADSTLALLGTVSGAVDCVKLTGVARIACHDDNFSTGANKLVIVDSMAFARVGTPDYAETAEPSFYGRWRLVPGIRGQVGVSEDARVVLFSDELLR